MAVRFSSTPLVTCLILRYDLPRDFELVGRFSWSDSKLPGWREHADTFHFGPRDYATGAAEVTESHAQYFNLEKLGIFIGLKTLWEG